MKNAKGSREMKKAAMISITGAVVILGIVLAPYIEGWDPVRCLAGAVLLGCVHFLGAKDADDGEDAPSEIG